MSKREIFRINVQMSHISVSAFYLKGARPKGVVWYKEVELQHMPLFLNRNDMFYWERKGPNRLVWSQMSDYLSEMRDLT